MNKLGGFKLRKKADPWIPVLGIGLSIIGLIMILSASQITSAQEFGSSYHFFIRQLLAWGVGLIGFFYFLRVPMDWLYEKRMHFFWATIVLLVLVFIPGIGGKTAGVYRWIGFGGFSIHSAEVAKLFLAIYFSAWFASKSDTISNFKTSFIPFIVALGILAGLIGALGRDLDNTLVIIVMAVTIFFIARAKIWQVGLIGLMAAAAIIALIAFTPYRLDRFQSYQAQDTVRSDPRGSNYHSQQALIAIGSGGAWGLGFGQGTSKYSYLPEAHTDSIFAVIAEELGFVRTTIILAAFFVLGWRGIRIAQNANSRFVCYLASGITTLIILQTLINIGGMLGVLPLAGITVPFLSYGGTSIMVSLSMLGLLTNASRETQ